MTSDERLLAALDRLPTVDDIDMAKRCIFEVKQEAFRIRSNRDCVMNPAPLSGGDAAMFASHVLDLVYHARWMARKLRQMIEEKPE